MTKIHYDTLPTRLESLQSPPLDPDVERDLIDVVQRTSSNQGEWETAFETLWAAHSRAAYSAVRRGSYDPKASRSQRAEAQRDALGEAALAFYVEVQEFDLSSVSTLMDTAHLAMRSAVAESTKTDQGVGLKRSAIDTYVQILRRFGHDFDTAYTACRLGGQGMSPEELQAIYVAINGGYQDIDELLIHGEDMPISEPEEIPDISLGLSALTDRERSIVKLAYGFTDEDTETLRLVHGFTPGERLFDRQIADILGVSYHTVFRARNSARRKMHAAILSNDS